jgi:hypothetical protein
MLGWKGYIVMNIGKKGGKSDARDKVKSRESKMEDALEIFCCRLTYLCFALPQL